MLDNTLTVRYGFSSTPFVGFTDTPLITAAIWPAFFSRFHKSPFVEKFLGRIKELGIGYD
jgi:hypothetical protein